MGSNRLVALCFLLLSVSSVAQVQPSGTKSWLNLSAGAGIDYWWGDWGGAVKGPGPSVWLTTDIWHGVGVNVEGHSLLEGSGAHDTYHLWEGEGGLIYTYQRWTTIQPFAKAELGFASLTHPDDFSGQYHLTSNTWAFGGGAEYHTWGRLWTRVDYTYDHIPHFYSSVTGQYHTLTPGGVSVGETFRLGQPNSRF